MKGVGAIGSGAGMVNHAFQLALLGNTIVGLHDCIVATSLSVIQ